MITNKTLKLSLKSLKDFAKKRLPDEVLRELDDRDECPVEIVHHMCNPDQLGIQLLFIPEEFGGMGGGTFDVYCVCEEMARIDLGVATAVLATFLGSDPIYGRRHSGAEENLADAYRGRRNCCLPTAPPSRKPAAIWERFALQRTRSTRTAASSVTRSTATSSGSATAESPMPTRFWPIRPAVQAGSSWKRARRVSATTSRKTSMAFASATRRPSRSDDVYVDADRLVGGVEGQGLNQAQAVFGYTRLMVAAFGLGGGWAALDRAIPYSTKRIQAGAPLSEKQGYTHKLIVPHVVHLEAARAYIEETAERIDAGTEGSLNTEGAIAKYMATEAGNAAAEASIQALGGYGYTHEYMVEKISRDVRITTIYEGTSEIMEMTISRDRWQSHLKTRGQYYHERAREFEALHARHPNVGAISRHSLCTRWPRSWKKRGSRA